MPGDANGDGIVGVVDLGILGANVGAGEVSFSNGDLNGDNMIDVADLGILGANWTGAESTQVEGLDLHVPEPATMAVVVIGLVRLGYCRVLHAPYSLLKQRYKTRL